MAAFDQCMANNGVTMPQHNGMQDNGMQDNRTPPSGAPAGGPPNGGSGTPPTHAGHEITAPPGVDEATWTKALNACKSLRPTRPAQPVQPGS